MKIISRCPACGNSKLLDEQFADRRVRCSACGLLFKVPRLEDVEKAVKVIEKANSTIYVDRRGQIYG